MAPRPESMVTLACKQCGTDYQITSARLRVQERHYGGRKYCSHRCKGDAMKAAFAARPAPMFTCERCNKEQVRPGLSGKPGSYNYKQRFCDQTCATAARKKSSDLPLGVKDRHGYIWLFSGGKGGRYTPQHRKVMEDAIGRPLRPEETVHHRNGQRADNRIENLELWSSRHGKGQRVSDKIAFAAEFLELYGYRPMVPTVSEAISAMAGLV